MPHIEYLPIKIKKVKMSNGQIVHMPLEKARVVIHKEMRIWLHGQK